MIKTLNRLVRLVLSAVLVFSIYAMRKGMTQITVAHETLYTFKAPALLNVRHISFFAVLLWCIVFAKSEPLFVRIGLVAIIVAFGILLQPLYFH